MANVSRGLLYELVTGVSQIRGSSLRTLVFQEGRADQAAVEDLRPLT